MRLSDKSKEVLSIQPQLLLRKPVKTVKECQWFGKGAATGSRLEIVFISMSRHDLQGNARSCVTLRNFDLARGSSIQIQISSH